MTAYDRFVGALRSDGLNVKDNGSKSMAQCPAHSDSRSSLSITRIDGSVLVYCHAGCAVENVLAAVGLDARDLYDDRKGALYDYGERKVTRDWRKRFRQSGNTKDRTLFHVAKIGDATTVYLCEGEKDVLAIESADGTAVCNAGGAGKAHLFDLSPLKGKHVVVVRHKDDAGHRHADQVSSLVDEIASSVSVVEAAVGNDAADHIAADKSLAQFVDVESELLADLKSAAVLDRMDFPDLVEHVPNLVTEGFGILAGSPKVGKSWLATGLALACAHGGKVFGSIKVEPRAVLLLALEDGERRLQNRMWTLFGDEQPLPARLDYLTAIKPGTVMPTVKEWMRRHRNDENPPLVIVDTFGKVRGQRRPGEDPYIADYQLGSHIKRVADSVRGAAILMVHHTRKMASEDWLASVSGSQGVTGSADYVLVLTRKRKSSEGVLAVTGRDIRENEYAMQLTGEGVWKLDGGSFANAAEKADERLERGSLDERAFKILQFVNGRAETRAEDLAELQIGKAMATTYLCRLFDSGRIDKVRRGVYRPINASPREGVRSVISLFPPKDRHDEITPDNAPNTSLYREAQLVCKHCREPLLLQASVERGYCAKTDCLLAGGSES